MKIFSAKTWREWVTKAIRFIPRGGVNCDVSYLAAGIRISQSPFNFWRHPWYTTANWVFNSDGKSGSWQASVWPGFLNGQDVQIDGVALTDPATPMLTLNFRNPTQPTSIGADEDGNIVYGKGEDYPAFFADLGVVPTAPGGALDSAPYDPNRTKQLAACDIFLQLPVVSETITAVPNPSAAITGEAAVTYVTTINNTFAASNPNPQLKASSKWVPPVQPSLQDVLNGAAVQPQTEEILIATVYLVSPPDANSDDTPDITWNPYIKYFCFWNLMHSAAPTKPLGAVGSDLTDPLNVLGFGADVGNAILSEINTEQSQSLAYLAGLPPPGAFWSI